MADKSITFAELTEQLTQMRGRRSLSQFSQKRKDNS